MRAYPVKKKMIIDEETVRNLGVIREDFGDERVTEQGCLSYVSGFPLYRGMLEGRLNRILESIPAGSKSVLDFGCGTGILLKEIVKKGFEVSAVDLDPEPARRFLELSGIKGVDVHSNKDRELSDIFREKFDVIIAAEVLEHMEEEQLQEALSEFHDVLAEDGTIIVSLPVEHLAYKIGRKLVGFRGDYHKIDCREIVDAIKRSRLNCVSEWHIPPAIPFYKVLTFKRDF